MCFYQKRPCVCGKKEAYIFHRDELLPEEVLTHLYCPECSERAEWNVHAMIEDGGWILEYNMVVARYYFHFKQGNLHYPVTPEFIFDGDYCSWYGLTPTDLEDNARMHRELLPLQRQDKRRYIYKLREICQAKVAGLKEAGWRKSLRT